MEKRLDSLNRRFDILESSKPLDNELSCRKQQERDRRFVEFDDGGRELLRLVLDIDSLLVESHRERFKLQ